MEAGGKFSFPFDMTTTPFTLTLAQFSDEFNKDGRTFYDGDDPFFQGVDIWYGVTRDLEVSFFDLPVGIDQS